MDDRIEVEVTTEEAGGLGPFPLELPPAEASDPRAKAVFTALYREYHPRLLAFFRSRGAQESSADLTQDALTRVYRKGGHFANAGAVAGFVLKVAEHVWINWISSRKARPELLAGLLADPDRDEEGRTRRWEPWSRTEPDALDEVIHQEQVMALRAAMEGLPPKMRRCVMLRACQGRSTDEIAALLRIAPNTVKAHLHQARERLLAHFGRTAEELEL